MEAQNLKEKTEDLISHAGDFLDTFYKVSLLKVTGKATQVASATIGMIIMCTLGMFVLFFAGLAAAWWLGDVLNNRTGGFLLVALFYLLLVTCIILIRRKIVFPYIRNLLIRKSYE
jgi:hypothetical protein